MGVTWGLAWFGAGMLILLTSLLLTGSTGADVPYPVGFGALGFLAGVIFSAVLSLVEGSRTFREMSMARFAGWGALGGGLFATLFVGAVTLLDDPGFFQNIVVLVPVFGAAGAACAAGALGVARRADDELALPAASPDPELLSAHPNEDRDV
jgi:hypothetical protein